MLNWCAHSKVAQQLTLWERALFRLTCAGARSPYLDEQDDDGQQVKEVSREPENVHLHFCFTLHTMTALCLKSHVFDDVATLHLHHAPLLYRRRVPA